MTPGTFPASSASVTPDRAAEAQLRRSEEKEAQLRRSEESAARLRPSSLLGYAGGAVLGGILLLAAYAKAIDPSSFAEQVGLQGLAVGLSPWVIALLGIAVEVGLGVALLLNLRSRTVLFAVSALVLFFLFLTGRDYWRAAHGIAPPAGGCGCFGNLVERTPAQAFWQDMALLLPSLALAWIGRPRAPRRLGYAIAGLAAAGAAAFAYAAPGLPLDDLATRLKAGTKLADLCGGLGDARVCLVDLVPEIAEGEHWVVIVDPADERFGALVNDLNSWTLSGKTPAVTALADITAEKQTEIFWRYAPAFDIHETPSALLRPLYRTLPRSFLVSSGRVVRTANGVAGELVSPPTAAVANNPGS